jgi:hypothetical protein
MNEPIKNAYWDQWIDNDDIGIYKLLDYKSFHLSIRQLDMETDDPKYHNKYRLCITGVPLAKLFDTPIKAKEYALEHIDNQVNAQMQRDSNRTSIKF